MATEGQRIEDMVINAEAGALLAEQFQNKLLRFRRRWWLFFAEKVQLQARLRYISSIDGEFWLDKIDLVSDIGNASGTDFDIHWDGVSLSLVWADTVSRSLKFKKGREQNGSLVFGEEKTVLWPVFAQTPTISKTNTGLTVVAFREENSGNLSFIKSNDVEAESWREKVAVGTTNTPNSHVEGIVDAPDFGKFLLIFDREDENSRALLGIHQDEPLGDIETLSKSDLASGSNWDATMHRRRYHLLYRKEASGGVAHTTGLIEDSDGRNEVIHSKKPEGVTPLGICLNEASGDVFDIWVWNGDVWIKKWDSRSEAWEVERLVARGVEPASYRSFAITPRVSDDGLIGISYTTGCINNTQLNFISINPDTFKVLNPEIGGTVLTFESCFFPPTGWATVVGVEGELERVSGISSAGISSMRSRDPRGEGAYIRRVTEQILEPFRITLAIRFVAFPTSGRQFIWWYGGVKQFVRLAVTSARRFRVEYSDGISRSSEGNVELQTDKWYKIRIDVPLPPGAVTLTVDGQQDIRERTLVKLDPGFEYVGNCGPGPSVRGSQFYIDQIKWTSDPGI
ncbi:MAG: hypothetical protein ACE5KG_05505 [Nitrososphaerales archaeon]